MSVSRAQFLKSLGASVTGMALGTGIASAAQALAQGMNAAAAANPPAPFDPTKVRFPGSGPSKDNQIAITFDDGPSPGVTDVVLDELKKRNLKSTFFMIGKKVEVSPDLAKRVLAEGHEVCNHTYNHLKLNTLPDTQVAYEIEKAQDVIATTLNHNPLWLRPPYGAFRKNQAEIPFSKKLGVVFWDVDPRDWSQPGEAKIVESILTQTKAGSIILCHDLHKQTANCVGQILDELLAKQYKFVSLSAFIKPQPQVALS